MIAIIADQVKAFRHQLGKHVVFTGSCAVLQPYEATVQEMLERMALEWAGDRVAGVPPDRRAAAAVEAFAEAHPSGAERAGLLAPMLADLRAGEGHVQLARLIKDGYVPLLFTMSPDDALEKALAAQRLMAGEDYHCVVAGSDSADAMEVAVRESTRVVVVKCGGDLGRRVLPLTDEEIREVLAPISELIRYVFRRVVIFTAYGDRDRAFLEFVPTDGDKVYWVNLHIPVADRAAVDEMKLESPDAEQYHKLQPEVLTLLRARNSERNLLCREAGRFSEFFGRLYERLRRRARSDRYSARHTLSVRRGGPFKFLEAFDVHDADFFYGREQEVQQLYELLREHPLVTLFGQLAVGKTSLLRAGLIPTLRHMSSEADGETELPWMPAYVTCALSSCGDIVQTLAACTEDIGFDPTAIAEAPSLHEAVRRVRELTNHRPVLLCDSVHEMFLKLSRAVRGELIEQLGAVCADDATQARVVFSLREDYLGELYEVSDALPRVFHHMLRLRKFTREQAADAILKPAANFMLHFDKELVDQMLEDLDREGILPAHLQIVCHGLLELAGPGRHYIGPMLYSRLGGARKHLDSYLSRAIGQLATGDRRLAWQILQTLATASETLASLPAEEVAEAAGASRVAFERVLARLDDMRLIRSVHRNGSRRLELIHDLLAEDIRAARMKSQTLTAQSAHDILTRGLDNFRATGSLLDRSAMHRVDDEREDLTLSAQELELAIRSAVAEGIDPPYWLGRLGELRANRYGVLADLLSSEDKQVRAAALKHAHAHLAPPLIEPLTVLAQGEGEEAAQARELLRSMRGSLVAALSSQDSHERSWAATAISHIGGRHLRDLVAALDDDHPGATEAVTDALVRLDPRGAVRQLLRSLVGPRPQWAAAEALGRLGQDQSVLGALQKAMARAPDSPHIAYALGLSLMRQRRYEDAVEVLETSVRLAVAQGLSAANAEKALDRCRHVLARSQRGEDCWPVAGGSLAHTHFVRETLRPPLTEFWTASLGHDTVGHVVAARGLVFAGLRTGGVVALDAASGTEVWERSVGSRIEVSPALAGDRVLFATVDGKLVGLSLSGDQLFTLDLRSAARSALTATDKMVFFGDRSGAFVTVDLESRESAVRHTFAEEVTASVSYAHGLAYVASWDATVVAFDLERNGAAWTWQGDEPVAGAVAVADTAAVWACDRGTVVCVEPLSGERLWEVTLPSGSRAGPAVCDDYVVVSALDGHVRALSRWDGEPVWEFETGDQVLCAPLIVGDVVYVGSRDGSLYALSLAEGEGCWQYTTSYGVYATPAVVEATLVASLRQRDVVAFVTEEEVE